MSVSAPTFARRRLSPGRAAALPALTALGLVAAASGCNCGAAKLQYTGPKISASPNPIDIGDAVTEAAVDTIVQVSNTGHGNLVFTKPPFVVMNTPVSTPVFAVLNLFEQNCDGSARNGNTTEIDSNGCAQLDLRFLPLVDGDYDGVLRFESNDPVNPTYDIPITTSAATPKVHICYENGGQETCNTDGQPLQVSVSTLVALGSSDNLSFELKSIGTRQVNVMSMSLTGDVDFTTTPAPSAFRPTTIGGGDDWPFTVVFAPVAGGLRTTTVTFSTQDPLNHTLSAVISAQGDGPALCTCVGAANVRCTPGTLANFGSVPVMGTGDMFVELSSCGTKPLTFGNVALTAGAPEFAATNLPASGTVFSPTDPVITIPLTFTPAANLPYTGQLAIDTTNQHGFIVLEGTGVQSGCHLEAASNTINFGSVATGIESKVTYAVSNTGTAECIITKPPAVTVGQPPFSLVSFPATPYSVQPGGSVPFTVGYSPTGSSGTDNGQLVIYYAGAPTNSPPQTLDVALVGTETATATCVLEALPGANALFGYTLNFGDVNINTTTVLPITFRNVGSANCTVSSATIVPPTIPLPGFGPSSAFTVQSQPTSPIPPGGTATLKVAFTPTLQEQYGSPLPTGGGGGLSLGAVVQVITSDDVTFPAGADCSGGLTGTGPAGCVSWGLSGQGVVSQLIVLPSAIDFGQVTLGCESATRTITLYNVGMTTIDVSGFTIDPAPPPDIFNLIAPPATAAAPIVIAAGASTTIQILYTPSELGPQTGTLYIDSNATPPVAGSTSNPYTTISLTGTGTATSTQTDTFIQPDHPTVDVLWVIDQDSDSMADKIAAIAANAQTFIQTAETDNTDFHLGVVSVYVAGNLQTNCSGANCTSGSSFNNVTIEPGVLYHDTTGPDWVSSTDANPTSEFANFVNIGISGAVTGEEAGLEAMYEALSTPNITGPNAGFLRAAARLIVIAISDDDDVLSPKPTGFYADFLKSLKPNTPQDVTFDMVGGDMPNGCTNGVDGDAPDRYNDVVTATGGKLYSICNGTAGYSQIASDLSLGSFGGLTEFVLSRPCDPTTLVVTVNGTMVTMGTTYTFSAAQNAINFATAPPAGATIVATYGSVCMP